MFSVVRSFLSSFLSDLLSADDPQQADNTLDELLRFIASLRVQRTIKKQEADALEELLFNNRSVSANHHISPLTVFILLF
jgi:hypothetical protein